MKVAKIISISILFVLFACNVNKRHPIPYFSFDIYIDLNLPSYVNLKGVGGWAYVNSAGSKGVVVYRKGQNEFVAFDRHSPSDEGFNCQKGLEVDDENFLILNDPCSDSRFSLYDGSVISGDSKWGLRSYLTQFDGSATLRIYNP